MQENAKIIGENFVVFIFDEVQFCPKARQAIRKLVKDHRFDYIETGSLLSIRKNVKDIRIPSEETQITLYPMDYEEFCWALKDEATVPLLQHYFEQYQSLGDAIVRNLLRDFRRYMLVGGMPQAVVAYLETANFEKVDAVKREIPAGESIRIALCYAFNLASASAAYGVSCGVSWWLYKRAIKRC